MNDSIFDNARILITGGTGSWGQTLTRLMLEKHNPKEIIIFSRGELQQVGARCISNRDEDLAILNMNGKFVLSTSE
jgi:FlaA1/EpsC-like NDP-sugar epimerase